MPLFEYECDTCMERYNKDIDNLAEKLNKTNATKIFKANPGIQYIEVTQGKSTKPKFSMGEKGGRSLRRFKWTLDTKNVLYMELKDFRFSELIYDKEEEKDLKCPLCKKKKGVRRIFSTFKAIFDDKNKRAPRPGDDLKFHTDYKIMKDEERESSWVGQDHLNQYFNR
jgi:hypothetical protein